MKKFPSVSVVTPTLNSERTLGLCLESISKQRYGGKIEIVIADGGSRDKTLSIAKSYKAKIVPNKLKTGEAGKAVGVRNSSGDILAFIDSDNILPDNKWMERMTLPFAKDIKVIATEPAMFTYRPSDSWLTRYFALIGMGDPLNLFIGNYDRYSYISGKWTGMHIDSKETEDIIELTLKKNIPTIGANGFLIRKRDLFKYPFGEYLFDIDVLKFLSRKSKIKVVKVKTGIVHLFSGDVATFARKQRRRIRDFLHYKKIGLRQVQTERAVLAFGVVKFTLSVLTVVPVLLQTLLGFLRKPDIAWLFHPAACAITLWVYGTESIRAVFITSEFSREGWKQ